MEANGSSGADGYVKPTRYHCRAMGSALWAAVRTAQLVTWNRSSVFASPFLATGGRRAYTSHRRAGSTCTCTHGGGGHMPACALFVPTKEQYQEVVAEVDKLREVAKAARRFLDGYDRTGGLANTQVEAGALDVALDDLKVSVAGNDGPVDPYWMK